VTDRVSTYIENPENSCSPEIHFVLRKAWVVTVLQSLHQSVVNSINHRRVWFGWLIALYLLQQERVKV